MGGEGGGEGRRREDGGWKRFKTRGGNESLIVFVPNISIEISQKNYPSRQAATSETSVLLEMVNTYINLYPKTGPSDTSCTCMAGPILRFLK